VGNSNRYAALENLVTTLGTITTGNGYATSVASVSRRFLDWETGPPAVALPAIGVVPNECTFEYLDVCTLRGKQRVAVEFVIQVDTQAEVWSAGDALIDDIIAAISVDRTRSGNALDTRVEQVETDAGNADFMDSRGGMMAGLVQVVIDFYRSLSVS
jgi:hypothetical protein